MREGWVEEDYLILFEDDELELKSANYSFTELLPGYKLFGLRSWDDFIVGDSAGQMFTVPTVPVSTKYLASFQLPRGDEFWNEDERFRRKIRWFLKPIIFGGDPISHQNQAWVNHDQHARLVRFWNKTYRSMQSNGA